MPLPVLLFLYSSEDGQSPKIALWREGLPRLAHQDWRVVEAPYPVSECDAIAFVSSHRHNVSPAITQAVQALRQRIPDAPVFDLFLDMPAYARVQEWRYPINVSEEPIPVQEVMDFCR